MSSLNTIAASLTLGLTLGCSSYESKRFTSAKKALGLTCDGSLAPECDQEDALTDQPETGLPTVTAVRVGSSDWTPAFRGHVDPGRSLGFVVPTGSNAQFDTMPWLNINRLYVSFSRDVGPSLTLSAFGVTAIPGYNADATRPATPTVLEVVVIDPRTVELQLSQAVGPMWLDLLIESGLVKDAEGHALDGNWTNGGLNTLSGDGQTSDSNNNFRFRIAVVPGDSHESKDQVVGASDVSVVLAKQNEFVWNGTVTPGYNPRADVNGNGTVNSSDVSQVLSRQNSFLAGAGTDGLNEADGSGTGDVGADGTGTDGTGTDGTGTDGTGTDGTGTDGAGTDGTSSAPPLGGANDSIPTHTFPEDASLSGLTSSEDFLTALMDPAPAQCTYQSSRLDLTLTPTGGEAGSNSTDYTVVHNLATTATPTERGGKLIGIRITSTSMKTDLAARKSRGRSICEAIVPSVYAFNPASGPLEYGAGSMDLEGRSYLYEWSALARELGPTATFALTRQSIGMTQSISYDDQYDFVFCRLQCKTPGCESPDLTVEPGDYTLVRFRTLQESGGTSPVYGGAESILPTPLFSGGVVTLSNPKPGVYTWSPDCGCDPAAPSCVVGHQAGVRLKQCALLPPVPLPSATITVVSVTYKDDSSPTEDEFYVDFIGGFGATGDPLAPADDTIESVSIDGQPLSPPFGPDFGSSVSVRRKYKFGAGLQPSMTMTIRGSRGGERTVDFRVPECWRASGIVVDIAGLADVERTRERTETSPMFPDTLPLVVRQKFTLSGLASWNGRRTAAVKSYQSCSHVELALPPAELRIETHASGSGGYLAYPPDWVSPFEATSLETAIQTPQVLNCSFSRRTSTTHNSYSVSDPERIGPGYYQLPTREFGFLSEGGAHVGVFSYSNSLPPGDPLSAPMQTDYSTFLGVTQMPSLRCYPVL